MIRVFNVPAVTWTLTAVLLLGACRYLLQAARSRQLTDQANKSLHALMNVLMAAMLWNLVPSTMLAQIAVLAGAALWFVIQAVARPEFKMLCAGRQARLKCVYHGLTMAGAAVMIAMMAYTPAVGHGISPAAASLTLHTHHAAAPAVQNMVVQGMDHSPNLAIPLTVFFGTAAVVFMVLLLLGRAANPAPHGKTMTQRSVRAEHWHEALGAAVMALMFATMSA